MIKPIRFGALDLKLYSWGTMKMRVATTESEIQQAIEVRYQSGFKPLGISREIMESSEFAGEPVIVICLQDDQVVGSATAFITEKTTADFIYLGVLADYQSQGIGKKLILEMEHILLSRGVKTIELCARDHLTKFYNSLGYSSVGDLKQFPEETIFYSSEIKVNSNKF